MSCPALPPPRGAAPGKAPPGKAPPPSKAPPQGSWPKGPGAPPPSRLGGRPLACGPPEVALSGPKLRPLFWTIAQVPPNSVWTDVAPPAPFDQAQLERQFALSETRPTHLQGGRSSQHNIGMEEPRKRIRVLDDRTSQLLAISFNRLPPPESLASVFETLEEFPEVLPSEAVLALHAAASEQIEPIEQLRQLNIPQIGISQLDVPERYLWVLASVPACAAKLACGALIVGPARELKELRLALQKVGSCCQALRSSDLIRKCASTSLAIGNFMNRGTSRSGARAVLLPDSLLKLDELRGVVEAPQDSGHNESTRAPSLLDFMAQALVDESGARQSKDLRAEAEELCAKARAAKTVSLEEAEATCNQICAAVAKAQRGLKELLTVPGVNKLAERVRLIHDEADTAVQLVKCAKDELALTQQWSCAKVKSKGEEWFAGWVQFLEQLTHAISRTSPPKPQATAALLRPALEEVKACQQSARVAEPNKRTDTSAKLGVAGVSTPIARAPPPVFDDDARAENFDIGALLLKAGLHSQAQRHTNSGTTRTAGAQGGVLHSANSTSRLVHSCQFDNKENMAA